MKYITRRLAVIDSEGKEREYSDSNFFAIDAPLIVLGEPGAGKSILVEEFSKRTNSPKYIASELSAYSSIEGVAYPTKIIIDGLDEITAYSSDGAANLIWPKLADLSEPNFILTCRAADWQETLNSTIIKRKWQKTPVVGRILPLNDREIVDLVDTNGKNQSGESFLKEAKRHDIDELLKNPQNLNMLLKAIEHDGWPDTKLQLYENACSTLLQESNEIHISINKKRAKSNKLLDVAGSYALSYYFQGKQAYVLTDQRMKIYQDPVI